jgi:CubicO group peptidase (beta-lactamase class C family)
MDAHSQWTGLDAGRLERITDHIERNYIGPQKIAGAQIAVSRHGHQAYLKSFGSMDLERQKPMMDDAIFRIYSMTKPITSIALMTLYEKGYFQLNDPVSRYVPSWKTHRVWVSGEGDSMVTEAPRGACHLQGRAVSHRRLHLRRRPARRRRPASGGQDLSRPEGAQRRRRRHHDGVPGQARPGAAALSPGERWMYSLATDICGALVEVISGKPFAQYLQEEIFGPLGMKDTSFFVAPDKIDRFCANYQRGPDKKLKVIDDPVTSAFAKEPGFKSGGGGLTGTTADYMRFCEMLRRGGELDGARVIGPRTLEMMHMNHLAGGKDLTQMAIGGFSETANEGVGFGLGFASTMSQTQTASLGTGDYYWGGAASTIFWVDPKEDLSVVFMTQLMPSEPSTSAAS